MEQHQKVHSFLRGSIGLSEDMENIPEKEKPLEVIIIKQEEEKEETDIEYMDIQISKKEIEEFENDS